MEKQSEQFSLERLSVLLERYSIANGEGAVEKLSRLAEQIVKVIAQNRKRRTPSVNYYRRRIE